MVALCCHFFGCQKTASLWLFLCGFPQTEREKQQTQHSTTYKTVGDRQFVHCPRTGARGSRGRRRANNPRCSQVHGFAAGAVLRTPAEGEGPDLGISTLGRHVPVLCARFGFSRNASFPRAERLFFVSSSSLHVYSKVRTSLIFGHKLSEYSQLTFSR